MENKINSQTDLYKRIKPALRTKKHELIAAGIKIVSEKDIWDYNKENKWRNGKGLTIASMVDDVLNTDNNVYQDYVIKKLNIKDDE
ncbi:MAG: post-transcriptional regulator [Bacilli bacterium]|nr:post-transcriptional regulator [Bacilli bacterium]